LSDFLSWNQKWTAAKGNRTNKEIENIQAKLKKITNNGGKNIQIKIEAIQTALDELAKYNAEAKRGINNSSASSVVVSNNNSGLGRGASTDPTVPVASASQSNSTEALSGGNNTLVNVAKRYTNALEKRRATDPNFAVNVNNRLQKVLGKLGVNDPNKNTKSVEIYKRFIKYLSNGKFNNENGGLRTVLQAALKKYKNANNKALIKEEMKKNMNLQKALQNFENKQNTLYTNVSKLVGTRSEINGNEATAIVEEQIKSVLPNLSAEYRAFKKAMNNAQSRNKVAVNKMRKNFNTRLETIEKSKNNKNAKTKALYEEYAKKFMSVKTNNGNGKSFEESLAQLNEQGPPTPVQATAPAPVKFRTTAAAVAALASNQINSNLKALITQYNNKRVLPNDPIHTRLQNSITKAGGNRIKIKEAYANALEALKIKNNAKPPNAPPGPPLRNGGRLVGKGWRNRMAAALNGKPLPLLKGAPVLVKQVNEAVKAKEVKDLLKEIENAMRNNPLFEKSNASKKEEVVNFVQTLKGNEFKSALQTLRTSKNNLPSTLKSLQGSPASTVSTTGSLNSSKTASTVSTELGRSFKSIVKQKVMPGLAVRVGGRAAEVNKPVQIPPPKKTFIELLNNRLEKVGKFPNENSLRKYLVNQQASNYKPETNKSLFAKYLETTPVDGSTIKSLSSSLKSLKESRLSKRRPVSAARSNSASSLGSTMRNVSSLVGRNLDNQTRNEEIRKYTKRIILNNKNNPNSLLKKLNSFFPDKKLRLENIHRVYGGGSNGKPFRMGNVYRNAGKEPIAKQFVSATPQIRGRKAAETKKVGEKYTTKRQQVTSWVLSGKGKNLFPHFKVKNPKSWNNIANAFGKINKFIRTGPPTGENLQKMYPGQTYNTFLRRINYKPGITGKNRNMRNNGYPGSGKREAARLRMNASRKSPV
jgi:hypothetical protein